MFRDKLTRRLKNRLDKSYFKSDIDYPYRGYEAMQFCLKNVDFDTVLDAGCGAGVHSNVFREQGKKVTALDYGESTYFKKMRECNDIKLVIADINKWETTEQYDLVWCSHVLEHQQNVNVFLTKMYSLVKEGGVLAITVPPLKHQIVSGHVSLWTPGILIYNLVLAGFDCSQAHIKTYDYDISVVVEKRTFSLPDLAYDYGDIGRLKRYFPTGLEYFHWKKKNASEEDYSFDGDIAEYNWDHSITREKE